MNARASPVRAVICDLAGTLVDFGSMAPVKAFMQVFQRVGVDVSEVRPVAKRALSGCNFFRS